MAKNGVFGHFWGPKKTRRNPIHILKMQLFSPYTPPKTHFLAIFWPFLNKDSYRRDGVYQGEKGHFPRICGENPFRAPPLEGGSKKGQKIGFLQNPGRASWLERDFYCGGQSPNQKVVFLDPFFGGIFGPLFGPLFGPFFGVYF